MKCICYLTSPAYLLWHLRRDIKSSSDRLDGQYKKYVNKKSKAPPEAE